MHVCERMTQGGNVQVTVERIKELREKTGVGIMECKKALLDCKGNMDAAVDLLREQGFSLAEKKRVALWRAGWWSLTSIPEGVSGCW